MNANKSERGATPDWSLGCIGAVLGGVVGWFAFFWIARQGFYMLALPGALIGVGGGFGMRRRSMPFAVACGVAGLLVGMLAEWRFAPFIKDNSLGYYLSHLHRLEPITLLFIALGGFFGFWLPFRAKRTR